MYDTGAITRDEVTRSLLEDEKRKAEQAKKVEEEERKGKKPGSYTAAGGGGSSGNNTAENTTAGGMTGIWARLFSSPTKEEDEASAYNSAVISISEPINFRKLDTTHILTEEYWGSQAAASDGSSGPSSSKPGLGRAGSDIGPRHREQAVEAASGRAAGLKVTSEVSATAAATFTSKPALSVGGERPTVESQGRSGSARGISVGAGGWTKKPSKSAAAGLQIRPIGTASSSVAVNSSNSVVRSSPTPASNASPAQAGSTSSSQPDQREEEQTSEAPELDGAQEASGKASSNVLREGTHE